MAKPCCDWETFEESLKYCIEKANFPELLIDWKHAKRCWNKGMMAHEAFHTITKKENQQAREYQTAVLSAKYRFKRAIK